MADESKYPTRIAPYGLRMPDDLKARIQAAAEANNRSMNAEIVATLEEKYPAPQEVSEFIKISREISYNAQRMAEIARYLSAPGGSDMDDFDELEYKYLQLNRENEALTKRLAELQRLLD